MRASIGYDREVVAQVNVYVNLRHYLTTGAHRPVIKVVPDMFNNVHRRCSIDNINGRAWRVVVAMADQKHHRYYTVLNTNTGERRIVSDTVVDNLY